MRTIVISDIHGDLSAFKALLGLVHHQIKDRLIILGDMIDRGPDSAGVVKLIRGFQEQNKNNIVLQGNHEHMAWAGFVDMDRELGDCAFNNGFNKTVFSYDRTVYNFLMCEQLKDDLRWMKNLPWQYQDDKLGIRFVHAGIDPNYAWDRQNLEELVWVREKWLMLHRTFDGKCPGDDRQWRYIFGHTPTPNLWSSFNRKQMSLTDQQYENFKHQVWHSGQMTNIDCGKAYGGKLAALVFTKDGCEQEYYV